MNILSLHCGHNATAALILDNRLECVLTEERFTNVKMTWGFPVGSVDYILSHYGLDSSNIDYVAYSSLGDGSASFQWRKPETSLDLRKVKASTRLFEHMMRFSALQPLGKAMIGAMFEARMKGEQKRTIDGMGRKFGFRPGQVKFVHHHVSHAYAPIGFFNLHKKKGRFLIFTLDGYGDMLAGSVGIYENGQYRMLEKIHYFDSLAWVYGSLTHYLGMQMNEHEYKVMGLAAYPSEKYANRLYSAKFEGLLDVEGGRMSLKRKTVHPHLYAERVFKELLFMERFDNIAYAVQKLTEEKVAIWVQAKMEKYKIGRIACSGGLFMNVKANKRIQELPGLEEAYFMPSSGDESLPIGSAFYMLEASGQKGTSPEITYLGKEFGADEIDSFISENGLEKRYEVERPKCVEKEAADLICAGEIVGRFSGRNEWGARSLGNRAIMADPRKLECIDKINHAIKSRDFWMPFAPSILEIDFHEYAIDNGKAPPYYMNTSFDTNAKGKESIKAATHRKDGTIRPNVVLPRHNARYCDTISRFKKLSGVGAVLNTSLNLHGYPMVGFLKELFITMDNSDLDLCVLENYLVRKKE